MFRLNNTSCIERNTVEGCIIFVNMLYARYIKESSYHKSVESTTRRAAAASAGRGDGGGWRGKVRVTLILKDGERRPILKSGGKNTDIVTSLNGSCLGEAAVAS